MLFLTISILSIIISILAITKAIYTENKFKKAEYKIKKLKQKVFQNNHSSMTIATQLVVLIDAITLFNNNNKRDELKALTMLDAVDVNARALISNMIIMEAESAISKVKQFSDSEIDDINLNKLTKSVENEANAAIKDAHNIMKNRKKNIV